MISFFVTLFLPEKVREWSTLSLILAERFDLCHEKPSALTEKGTQPPAPR
jgi:hypothetical protein